MDLSRVGAGQTPFITNISVYKAGSALDQGAIIAATANTASLQGAVISVLTTTAAGDNEIGVTQVSSDQASSSRENLSFNSHRFNIGTDGFPDATTADGMNHIPTCINPDALYYALISETTSATTVGDAINVGISATLGTSVVLGSQGVDHAGGWLFSSAVNNSADAAPTFSGSLRYVSQSAASDTFGLATAMNVSTDGTMLVLMAPGRKKTCISSGGNLLRSQGCGTVGMLAQSLLIQDNYVIHDSAPHHPLRFVVDDGLDGLTGVRLYSELALTDSYYVNG